MHLFSGKQIAMRKLQKHSRISEEGVHMKKGWVRSPNFTQKSLEIPHWVQRGVQTNPLNPL